MIPHFDPGVPDRMAVGGYNVQPEPVGPPDSGVIEPRGYYNIETFHLDGTIPDGTYTIAGRHIEKRIWLEHVRKGRGSDVPLRP